MTHPVLCDKCGKTLATIETFTDHSTMDVAPEGLSVKVSTSGKAESLICPKCKHETPVPPILADLLKPSK